MIAALVLLAYAAVQEDGKSLVERSCAKCHDLDATLHQRNTRERWSAIVDEMVARGAEISDADIDRIIDYLAKTQGPKVNVNRASAAELAGVLELPVSVTEAVIDYRTKHGPFKSFEDFKQTPALAGKDIESKKDRLDF